ncbi:B12-binding protein [Deferribacterales bacterium RsTz2092]|nr:B12-binding protein [Deferribacterales bacterium]
MSLNLLSVSKPLRYTGGELGMLVKEPAGKLRFCLIFPDIYEIGMSHLGFRILYTNLNRSESIYCERFFAPWRDAMDKFGAALMLSLETHTPISDFDIVGFSFQYEMAYTTALQTLKLAGVSLRCSERGENEPLVIAGGCCTYNPAPLADFIDVFFIGEMDAALVPALEKLHKLRQAGGTRREQLEMLDKYPFTYIPSITSNKIAKREIYKGFPSDTGAVAPLVPTMPIVQDRLSAEISRGCSNGCRFCQAGVIYRPVRERGVENIHCGVMALVDATGEQEVSLLSLDSGDYSQIEPLLDRLGSSLNRRHVSLALPSLRAETVNQTLLAKAGMVRKGGFTIAPEAGTQRLRDIINKNITEDEILNAAIYAKRTAYNGVKLYFMCGLPYETDEDLLGIAELVKKIRSVTRTGRGFDITVSVSNFVPKPHTPFERFGMASLAELQRKHSLIKGALSKERVKLRFHDAQTSILECAFTRADDSINEVLAGAVESDFYLDAWSEYFSAERWAALFAQFDKTPEEYACKNYTDDEKLPWANINCGVSDAWLKSERDKAAHGQATGDCRKDKCSSCGVCDFKELVNVSAPQEKPQPTTTNGRDNIKPHYLRYVLHYSRADVASYMSALESIRMFSHILLSAGIRLKFSEGFNPQARLVLPCPLPVGVAGENEMLLFEAEQLRVSNELLDELNKRALSGLKFISIKPGWLANLSDFHVIFAFDEASFDYVLSAMTNGSAYYERNDKKGNKKRISLTDYLKSVDKGARTIEVGVTNMGGFHFPDFFRYAGYAGQPEIVRKRIEQKG